MKTVWLHRAGGRELIVFCAGWGMDENPVRHLACGPYDVLVCYDYSDLPEKGWRCKEVHAYETVHLIGWSMGVWAGERIATEAAVPWGEKIAINGTLCPIDDKWGIPRDIYQATVDDFDLTTRLKFYRRMCRTKENLDFFLRCQPQRELEDQRHELRKIDELVACRGAGESTYTRVIVSSMDFIMPTASQLDFWKKYPVQTIPAYHYPFGLFHAWAELMDVADLARLGRS
jgi:biotin synthesis protein BioG